MNIFITFLLTLLIALLSTQTFSQQLIPFQARLTDGAGAPVADGVYSINFAIYGTATGGTPVNGWVESHATVSVVSGVVNVILGSITPLNDPDNNGDFSDAVTFYTTDGNRFIGVTIGAGQEMVPRHQLVPSFHAATADDAAKFDGKDSSYYITDADLQGMVASFTKACPSGWLVADGTSGTPDLRNKFLRGETTASPASLDFGGNDDATVASHSHDTPSIGVWSWDNGAHNHFVDRNVIKAPGAFNNFVDEIKVTNCNGCDVFQKRTISSNVSAHKHFVGLPVMTTTTVGSSATNTNIPGYYEVIYCVKQ